MFEDKRLNELAAATERQAEGLRPRLRNLDRSLTILGSETGKVLIIMLALAVLCAPAGLGLVAAWLAWLGVIAATGSAMLAWIVAFTTIAFYCRYVWGSRLQGSARRAAQSLLAPRSSP
jgi:sterol desaturase/sphingolipid hydroxylase (fatty acid hydroxylase superfamily)